MNDPRPEARTAAAPGPGADRSARLLVLVTGPSGAGRTTALAALEDLGYERIDNLPLSFVPRLFEGSPLPGPVAVGIDARNREFASEVFAALLADLRRRNDLQVELLFLDCAPATLARRFAATRRRHPLAPAEDPEAGIAREADLLAPLRDLADVTIDTTALTPRELRAAIGRWFDPGGAGRLAVTVQSFSYKRGAPPAVDMLFDCRFLRNPYWEPALRDRDGRDPEVAAYVAADPLFEPFFARVAELTELLLPAQLAEGKTHLALAFGCTGGQHRSVTVAEKVGRRLEADGWQVSIRHRELDRRAAPPAGSTKG